MIQQKKEPEKIYSKEDLILIAGKYVTSNYPQVNIKEYHSYVYTTNLPSGVITKVLFGIAFGCNTYEVSIDKNGNVVKCLVGKSADAPVIVETHSSIITNVSTGGVREIRLEIIGKSVGANNSSAVK